MNTTVVLPERLAAGSTFLRWRDKTGWGEVAVGSQIAALVRR